MSREELNLFLDKNWANERQQDFLLDRLGILVNSDEDKIQKIRRHVSFREKPLPFSRDELMAQALPPKQPNFHFGSFVAGVSIAIILAIIVNGLMPFVAPQQAPIRVGNQSQPPTQLIPTPQPPASPTSARNTATVPPTLRPATQTLAGELKPGNTVKVKSSDGAAYLTEPVPFGSDWNKYKTGKAAVKDEVGIVTEIDQSGKFVKFTSSVQAVTEGWIDAALVERLPDPVATGEKKVLQKFEEPAGTGPLQLGTLNDLGSKTYSLTLQGANDIDSAKVWGDGTLLRYIVLESKRAMDEVVFQANFACKTTNELHSMSVTTFRNGFVVGSTTRPVTPCK